jgi:hypothetical protein
MSRRRFLAGIATSAESQVAAAAGLNFVDRRQSEKLSECCLFFGNFRRHYNIIMIVLGRGVSRPIS